MEAVIRQLTGWQRFCAGWLSFWGLEYFGQPNLLGCGKVLSKKSYPHTWYTVGGFAPRMVNDPPVWELAVEVKGQTGYLSVSQDFFKQVNEGDIVPVAYRMAKITGRAQVINQFFAYSDHLTEYGTEKEGSDGL